MLPPFPKLPQTFPFTHEAHLSLFFLLTQPHYIHPTSPFRTWHTAMCRDRIDYQENAQQSRSALKALCQQPGTQSWTQCFTQSSSRIENRRPKFADVRLRDHFKRGSGLDMEGIIYKCRANLGLVFPGNPRLEFTCCAAIETCSVMQ